MTTIKLKTTYVPDSTSISNEFFDNYMPMANGDFVKVYLYLLRCLADPSKDVSISFIADKLNITDNDVERALRYWASISLIELEYMGNVLTGVTLLPLSSTDGHFYESAGIVRIPEAATTAADLSDIPEAPSAAVMSAEEAEAEDIDEPYFEQPVKKASQQPAAHTYTPSELKHLLGDPEIHQLIYVSEKYLGKTLNASETNKLLYFYETLGFQPELIEYLIEYCVSKEHKSFRYIEKVALSWADQGITTVSQAKEISNLYSKNIFAVMKAFGLGNRGPGEAEKNYINQWYNTYGFSLDIIVEACNRTIQAIHQPSFEYADSILKKWKKEGVHHLSDLKILDDKHQRTKENKEKSKKEGTSENKTTNNKFNKFPQRTYDYAELEKQLLNR